MEWRADRQIGHLYNFRMLKAWLQESSDVLFQASVARGVLGGFVRLGGSGRWVDFGVGSWLKLAMAPVVAGVKDSCESVHEGCLWNLVKLLR
jgi:hypothetical protein